MMSKFIRSTTVLAVVSYAALLPKIAVGQTWQVEGQKEVLEDPAVAAARMELQTALENAGIKPAIERHKRNENTVFTVSLGVVSVGHPYGFNEQEAQLLSQSAYQIRTDARSPRTIQIAANVPLGLSFALFDISDQVRIHHRIPEINKKAVPALPYRFLLIGQLPANTLLGPNTSGSEFDKILKQFEESTIEAVKYGYNFIVLGNSENFFLWTSSGYQQRSKRFGAFLNRFIEIAHAYHLGLLLIGDEFIYLPVLLKQYKSTASVKDENFWHALQAKYREFLAAYPKLDGVATRIGEIYPHYDFKAFDVIHSPETEPNPRIEERYRRFVKTIHKVVVQEFGKIYPRLNRGLLLAIKLTCGDQWHAYEPYNDGSDTDPH